MTLERPTHTPEVEAMIKGSQDVADWIAKRQHDLEISGNRATIIPGLQYDQCIEHHVAIVGLVSHHIYGSAFALVRASAESLVRGVWLQRCAMEAQLDAFTDNDKLPRNLYFADMVAACVAAPGFDEGAWLQALAGSWGTMNSFTHTGTMQLGRRLKGNEIYPNYQPDEIIEVLRIAATSALVALKQIAEMSGKQDLIAEVTKYRDEGGPIVP
jgi:hypothetical protein